MSKEKFAEVIREKRSSVVPEHLTPKAIFKDIVSELKHQAKAGAHELAAALLRSHDGFVMYPRTGKDDEGHGMPKQEQNLGREM